MKRKNNRNLLGVIALIVISAFMLISCPQQTSTLAKENPRALTLNYSGRSTIYYYLNNNWYSDKECKNVVEDPTLQPPAAQIATITVNFNEGTAQATGEGEYFQEGSNSFTWNFVKYVKAGDESKADYFGGVLKLPENGISENVTLTAEYDTTEVVRTLPVLVREGITFGGYQRVNETVEADTPITVTPGLIAMYNAIWTTYKTLTLNIGEQEQKLYYGSNGAWYKALSDDGLLLDENKVTGDEVKFNIPSAPTWTVTFKKNIPEGTSYSEITITPAFVDVTPDLTLTPGDLIDNTGKVVASSIDGDKVVTGTYPPKAIGQSVTPSSTNLNYEFEKWTANGEDITDIADHQVNGNTEIVANWKNLSDFKVLTIKDGGVVKDTAYYNTTYNKWYKERSTTSEVKTSVVLPGSTTKTYTITLKYNNGSEDVTSTLNSTFSGYGLSGADSANIPASGELKDYTIENDTVLVSKWDEVKITKPENPTRDGYVFNGWYNGDDEYSFDSVVTGDITLVAHWKEKPKKLTVKDGVNEQDTAWYSREDNKWYADENMTGEKTSVRTPQDKTYTITLNYDNGSSNGSGTATSSFSGYEDGSEVKVQANGLLSGYTINSDTELVAKWSDAKFDKPSDPTKDGYTFEAWYNGESLYSFDSVVTGNMTLTAHWTKKTFNTLTFDITGLESPVATQTLYYGSDGAWYKALGEGDLLLDDNKVTGDVKFNIPEAPTWTVTLNKNTPTNQHSPITDDNIILSKNQLTLYPKDGVFSSNADEYIYKDGIVKVTSITENVNVTLDTSRRRTSENVEATTPDSIKLVGWLNGAEQISKLSEYYVTADNISLNASWGYKVSIGELKVPGVGISDADRGFYTTTQDIDESVKDKSKQQRVAYYTEGETVKLYYCNSSIMGIEITLTNEWSGETTLINPVGTYKYTYSLLEIASMANQPLSISFNVTKSEVV